VATGTERPVNTSERGSAQPSTRAGRLRRPGDSRFGDYMFVLPAVAFIALLMLYPIVYNFNLSLHDTNLGNFLSGSSPFVGLDNYVQAFGQSEFWHSLVISLVYTGGSIAFSFVAGFALALFFNKAFPGSGTMRAILLLAYVFPSVVSGTVWRWMLQGEGGIINALLQRLGVLSEPVFWLTQGNTALISVIVTTVWVTTPFVMILLLAGLQGISPSLYEAVQLDGANAWQRFRYVTLPLVRPVALTVLLLSFIFTFKTFDNVYVMTRGGPGDATSIMPIYAYDLAFQFFRFSEGAVATTVLIAISVVMSLAYFWASRREEAA
jgi:multiple sugar transport system permease protein